VAVQGHAKLLERLHTHLPPVSLFLGPTSVGRWAVAEHLRWFHSVHVDDVLRVRELTPESAELIKEFSLTSPAASKFKLILVDLHKSNPTVQASILSVLENPKEARIILIGQASEAQNFIRQHAVIYRFSFLRPEEVARILVEKLDFSEERAEDLALRSGGQVVGALSIANADDSLARVRAAILALRSHDKTALAECAKTWVDEDTMLLGQWCNEAIASKWRVFSPEDAAASPSLPIRILLSIRPRVRPRLVVRSQLMSILKEYQ
jgi:replication-associated recombination protein RarA